MKRKVLIATYYWPPSGGAGVQRFLKFVKYLPEFGIEPVVLTVENPTYPIRDASLKDEIPDSAEVYTSKTIEPFGIYAGLSGKSAESISPATELEGTGLISKIGGWIRANLFIPDARVGWLLTARKKAEEIARKHDISAVITTGPPHSVHFIGRSLQKNRGLHWIADFRDPWSKIYYNQVLPRTKIAEYLDRKLEKSVLEKADDVIAVTPSQAGELQSIKKRSYHLITNGFDHDDFEGIEMNTDEPPPYLIRHVGSIGEPAIPEAFLQALKIFSVRNNVKVEFIGEVHRRLPELTRELGLENVVDFIDYLPHKQALIKMCHSHILLLSLPDVSEIRHHIPGKLFEYLGTGRPILMLGPENGDAADLIREQQAGVVCAFRDRDKIFEAFHKLSDENITFRRDVLGADHPFSRRQLTGKLAEIIKRAPNRKHRI